MGKLNAGVTPTSFVNIFVIATPKKNENTGEIEYNTVFVPETINVRQSDTIINYQLIDPTPSGVRIDMVSVLPEHSSQLSIPSIGQSGKLVTFSDANTVKETFNVTLHFSDSDGVKFKVDPEIVNEPEPR